MIVPVVGMCLAPVLQVGEEVGRRLGANAFGQHGWNERRVQMIHCPHARAMVVAMPQQQRDTEQNFTAGI